MVFVDHIAIKVSDLQEAKHWYLEQLKAEITFQDSKYIRLKVANTNIALIDEKFYPYAHIAILVEHKRELPVDGEVFEHRDGTIGVFVKDPFGNYLEYIWYSPEHSKVFLE